MLKHPLTVLSIVLAIAVLAPCALADDPTPTPDVEPAATTAADIAQPMADAAVAKLGLPPTLEMVLNLDAPTRAAGAVGDLPIQEVAGCIPYYCCMDACHAEYLECSAECIAGPPSCEMACILAYQDCEEGCYPWW